MKKASNANPTSASDFASPAPTAQPAEGRSLWIWVAAGFLFLGLLWTAMFLAARKTHIDSVPLTTQGGKS